MVGRLGGCAQVVNLLGREAGFAQQRQHAHQAMEGRPDLVADVGQEGGLGLAGALGLPPCHTKAAGQLLQHHAPRTQLAHLAKRDVGKGEGEHRHENRQAQAQLVLLAHGQVAFFHLFGRAVGRTQRQAVNRCAQRFQFEPGVGQEAAAGSVALFAQLGVGAQHEALQSGQRLQVRRVLGQAAAGAVTLQQAQSAHEDLVAQLQRLDVLLCGHIHGVAPALAQAQVLDLGLVDAEHGIVVAGTHRVAQQRELPRLHQRHRQQRHEQPEAHQPQPAKALSAASGDSRRNGLVQSTSIVRSCHAERP